MLFLGFLSASCYTAFMSAKKSDRKSKPAKKKTPQKDYIKSIEDPRLKKAAIEAESICRTLDIPIGNITSIRVNPRFTSKWGTCINHRTAVPGPNGRLEYQMSFEIEISPRLVSSQVPYSSLLETVLHEYLHTAPGCQNHGPQWKAWAALINRHRNMDITRTSSPKDLGVPERQIEYKYAVQCLKCGRIYPRQKCSELIKHPEDYRCKCGGSLKRLDHYYSTGTR